jgi:hypothetical protein
MDVIGRVRLQNLQGRLLLSRVAHIQPKHQAAARELLLDAPSVALMEQPTESGTERVEFEPTVRLPVQRFSSSKILVLACAVQWLSVCSDLAFMMR